MPGDEAEDPVVGEEAKLTREEKLPLLDARREKEDPKKATRVRRRCSQHCWHSSTVRPSNGRPCRMS
jgi:hypothetical protein